MLCIETDNFHIMPGKIIECIETICSQIFGEFNKNPNKGKERINFQKAWAFVKAQTEKQSVQQKIEEPG